jgi:phosphate transport system substrate-binding protein
LLAIAIATCAPLAAPPAWAATESMAVIVHPATPVKDLTMAEVRKIFLGDRQYWTADMPVVLIVRAPVAPERAIVLHRIYRMSESQFKQYWIARIFRAEAPSTPKVVYSNETVNELVSAIPGAISLVRTEAIGTGVRVLRIDGALPGEDGYPLR